VGLVPQGSAADDTQTPPAQSIIDRSLSNTAPVADAGENQTASAGGQVILSGTGSSDADGDALIFFWRQVGDGDSIELNGRFSAVPRFDAPNDAADGTTYTFRLEVSDGFSFATDEVTVTIESPE
jgi:hypothetical protein